MVDIGAKLWKDGQILDAKTAGEVSLLTHTLHYGVGAFEGIRAYQRDDGHTYIFRLQEHIERLFDSCRLAIFEPSVSPEQVTEGCIQLLRENGLKAAYLRPLVLLGEGAMGLLPTNNPPQTYVMAWEWGTYLGKDGLDKGIRCKISSFSRLHANVNMTKGKLTGQYINSVMAKREAQLAGYDEALLLDVNGYVCEGSGENIFIVKKGRLYTPPASASILPGITRDTIMTLAREDGLVVEEAMLTRDQLYLADEVFLVGTAAEVTPVREVDNRPIGCLPSATPKVGPVTQSLQKRYFDLVRGADESHPEWLTRV